MKVTDLRKALEGVGDNLDVVICLTCPTVDGGEFDYEAEGLLTKVRIASTETFHPDESVLLLEGYDVEHESSPIGRDGDFRQHIKIVRTDA